METKEQIKLDNETRQANAIANSVKKIVGTSNVKKSVNSTTTVKKASTASKAKKETVKTINDLLQKSSANRGQRTSIYNPAIYEGLTKKQQTSLRSKLRRNVSTVYSAIFNYSDKGMKKVRTVQSAKAYCSKGEGKQVKADFIELYTKAYLHNDLSPASMYNGNDEETIKQVQLLSAALK